MRLNFFWLYRANVKSCKQAIRPITVFRKNANWKATISYMEDLCMLYSVFMTAKKMAIVKFGLASRNHRFTI